MGAESKAKVDGRQATKKASPHKRYHPFPKRIRSDTSIKTRSNTMEIKRDVYLEQFKIRKDNGMIKIITGKCVNIGRHRTKGEDEAAEYN